MIDRGDQRALRGDLLGVELTCGKLAIVRVPGKSLTLRIDGPTVRTHQPEVYEHTSACGTEPAHAAGNYRHPVPRFREIAHSAAGGAGGIGSAPGSVLHRTRPY